jgi:antitoxin component YwqK of YwqJK toxin-antitoxin module
MRPQLLLCLALLGLSTSLFAQDTIYQFSEVDSAAVPRGGTAMLDLFLRVNVQKPFMAQVANVTGRVMLRAVIEPTGRVSTIQVVDGLRPDCNREAVRVFGLFNAWKPAQKGGKSVRQVIDYQVFFDETPPVAYEDGNRVTFYDRNNKRITNSSKARYVLYEPIDTVSARPTADAIYYEIDRKKELTPVNRLPFVKQIESVEGPSKDTIYRIGYKPEDGEWMGMIYLVRRNGSLHSELPANRIKNGLFKHYLKNGMAIFMYDYAIDRGFNWFPNGSLHSVLDKVPDNRKKRNGLYDYKMKDAWDSTGYQMVRDGSGYLERVEDTVRSLRDTTKFTAFIEKGFFKNGLKDGVWKGYYADSSFSYEERFENEEAFEGKAIRNGKVTTYEMAEIEPEFKGGEKALVSFINNRLVVTLIISQLVKMKFHKAAQINTQDV